MKKILLTLILLAAFGTFCFAEDGDMPNGSKCYTTPGCTGGFANPNSPGDEKEGSVVSSDDSSTDLFVIFLNTIKDELLYLTN